MDKLDIIEHIQEKPYWLIDVLPYQVPADSAGQYFKVEEYLLAHMDSLGRKFLDVLLKLNCYKDLKVGSDGDNWVSNPSPVELERSFRESISSHFPLFILIQPGDAMVTFSGDDHYMTLYNPDAEMLDLVRQLAAAEGLFVWGPKHTEP